MEIKTIIAEYTNSKHEAEIISLLNEYASGPMGGGEPLGEFTRKNLIASLATTPGAFSVLSYVESIPVGLANCFQGFSTFQCKPLINIHDIVVIKSHRNKGISQHLLNKIEEVALERQCCKITLEVLDGNLPAITAYKKFGFFPYELNRESGRAMFWEKKLKP